MHEVFTIQIGQQANYIGTHFWNAQESYFTYGTDDSPVDHDIHFRPGKGVNGQDTFTPRVLIYDLKDSFGTLQRENALYLAEEESNQAEQISQWPGATHPLRQPAIPESPYQAALNASQELPSLTKSEVRYWSDYNHVFYHPRSLQTITTLSLTDSLAPFEHFTAGEEVFRLLDGEYGLLDRDVRPWLEECDLPQAVQLNTGVDGAWGGFAARLIEGLRDEVGKTSIWVAGVEQGDCTGRDRQNLQLANSVRALQCLTDAASLYMPLTSTHKTLPSYIQDFDQSCSWHTSALQASALESVTLPLRLRSDQKGATRSTDVESTLLNDGKRKLVHLGLSVSLPDDETSGIYQCANGSHDARQPAALNGNGNGFQHSDKDEGAMKLDIDYTPVVHEERSLNSRAGHSSSHESKVFGQIQSLRGMFKSTLEIDDINHGSRSRFSTTAADGMRFSCHQTRLLYPLLASHPQIYRFEASHRKLDKVATRSTLTVSSAVAIRLRALERRARLLIGVEEREALSEGLLTMAEEYVDGWEDESSDGEG